MPEDEDPNCCYYNGKKYSPGSEECHGDVLKECRNGTWHTLGKCPSCKSSDRFPPYEGGEEYKLRFGEDLELNQHYTLTTRTIWADYWSVRDTGSILYCRGARTRGHACAGHFGYYQIPSLDVINIGREDICPDGRFWICEITYNTASLDEGAG